MTQLFYTASIFSLSFFGVGEEAFCSVQEGVLSARTCVTERFVGVHGGCERLMEFVLWRENLGGGWEELLICMSCMLCVASVRRKSGVVFGTRTMCVA